MMNFKDYPNILICTIECWNSQNGANTFPMLFQNYPSEKLSNLYIRAGVPDSDCCSRYFQISEQRVIRNIFNKRIRTGREITGIGQLSGEDREELKKSRALYVRNIQKRPAVKLLGRELLWKLGAWKSRELNTFLQEVKPDLIVFEMSGYGHFNRICRYAVEYTGAKGLGYFYDDNFTFRQIPGDPASKLIRIFQRASLKKLASRCSGFWAITEKTKQEADDFFHIHCTVLTKPIDFTQGQTWQPYQVHHPIRMVYTGNLMTGRMDTVCAISRALEKLNKKDDPAIVLDVYTNSYVSEKDLKRLSPYVRMQGARSQDQVAKLQEQADILLFVESMTGRCSQYARLSFSAKLTDYFGSGKCIFAAGAADTAPMEYLVQQKAAVCVYDEQSLLQKLTELAECPDLILETAKQGFACGLRSHSRALIEEKMMQSFAEIQKGC